MSQLIESVARDQWINTRMCRAAPPPSNNLYVESAGERPEHLRQGAQERIDLYLAAQTEVDNAGLSGPIGYPSEMSASRYSNDKLIEKITRAEWIVYQWSNGHPTENDPMPGMIYSRGQKRHPMESIRAAAEWDYYQAVIADLTWQHDDQGRPIFIPDPPLDARVSPRTVS